MPESAARRAFGVSETEARKTVVVETTEPDPPIVGPPRYTRAKYRKQPGKRLYEATASSGYISVRASAVEMKWATNVIDLAGETERQRQGRIWAFFAGRREAEQQAAVLTQEGYLVSIVEARPYAGQPGDDE